jgi:hypothetical protein
MTGMPPTDRDSTLPSTGWALLIGAMIVVVAFLLLVVVSQQIIVHGPGSRMAREVLATTWFFVALVGIAAAIRWGQGRHAR